MDKIQKHKELCDEINDVYRKKNEDYGDSVGRGFEKFGDLSIFLRMTDKWNRLDNMMELLAKGQQKEVNYESLDDTIMDLANYALIWLMERRLKDNN